jgi:hypothetical protein
VHYMRYYPDTNMEGLTECKSHSVSRPIFQTEISEYDAETLDCNCQLSYCGNMAGHIVSMKQETGISGAMKTCGLRSRQIEIIK